MSKNVNKLANLQSKIGGFLDKGRDPLWNKIGFKPKIGDILNPMLSKNKTIKMLADPLNILDTSDPLAPPPVMPIADDEETARARRRSMILQMARSGRNSTVLTNSDSYSGDTLG